MKLKFKITLDKKTQQALAVSTAAVAAILALYIWLVWLPLSGKIDAEHKNLSDIQSKINQATQQAQKKHRLDVELEQLTQAAAEANQRLPQDQNVPAILVTVSDLADQYQVQLQSFSPPKAPVTRGFFNELDFPVSILGSYNALGQFMAALSLQERIFNVANVVYGGPDGNGNIPARFTLIAYIYKG